MFYSDLSSSISKSIAKSANRGNAIRKFRHTRNSCTQNGDPTTQYPRWNSLRPRFLLLTRSAGYRRPIFSCNDPIRLVARPREPLCFIDMQREFVVSLFQAGLELRGVISNRLPHNTLSRFLYRIPRSLCTRNLLHGQTRLQPSAGTEPASRRIRIFCASRDTIALDKLTGVP